MYFYRRRIPKTANGEVVLSLRTRVFRVAESMAEGLDRHFERLVRSVTTNGEADLHSILRTYLKQRLDFDMSRREETPHAPIFGWPEPGKSHASIDLEWIDHELAIARSDLAERAYGQQRPLIDEVMEAHGVPAEHRNALAHGILRANVELWETVRKRTLGAYPPLNETALRSTPSERPEKKPPAGPAMTEVLPAFLDYAQKDKGWRGQTLAQNKTSYRMFQECCGDSLPQPTSRLISPSSTICSGDCRHCTRRAESGRG